MNEQKQINTNTNTNIDTDKAKQNKKPWPNASERNHGATAYGESEDQAHECSKSLLIPLPTLSILQLTASPLGPLYGRPSPLHGCQPWSNHHFQTLILLRSEPRAKSKAGKTEKTYHQIGAFSSLLQPTWKPRVTFIVSLVISVHQSSDSSPEEKTVNSSCEPGSPTWKCWRASLSVPVPPLASIRPYTRASQRVFHPKAWPPASPVDCCCLVRWACGQSLVLPGQPQS